eukprot:CAMPEP_0201162056 /NCGR_PEP_ID=MMETSP0851-20130426/50391_1 /ASSEMBLY_ACC=CAM_ASM_000631 /TAXON_ID=183588 /ORGANISM="Pseudo-nitzschia fraudulenta, Strain WWA7" /LENGTH=274 /DNA_ID=CAMNT_0047441749 /DNA_START=264 /DNA_END=1088 /DNA_ORIENTATION=-
MVDGTVEESMASASCSSTTTSATMPPVLPQEGELAAATANANPISVEGIELPGYRVVDGTNLYRNGHGMRSLVYFGIGIRIYVAAMYSVKPILSVSQAMGEATTQANFGVDAAATVGRIVDNKSYHNDNGPLQLDFTFLRYVRQSQVVSAWTQQLDHSVAYKDYDGYEADRDQFIALASGGPIENSGTQSVVLVGDETRIIDQGTQTGVILGKDFQRSFLSMWFGPMAVSEELKLNLLKGDEHHPSDIREIQDALLRQESSSLSSSSQKTPLKV